MPTRGCDRFQAITVRRMRAVSIRIRQPHDGPAADRRSATPWDAARAVGGQLLLLAYAWPTSSLTLAISRQV